MRDVIRNHHIPPEHEKDLEEFFLQSIVASPEKISSLSRTLRIFAEHIAKHEQEAPLKSAVRKEESSSRAVFVFAENRRVKAGFYREKYPIDKERDLLSAIADGDRRRQNGFFRALLPYTFFFG